MDQSHTSHLRELARRADRLDSLADMAELMGDGDGAIRLQARASSFRLQGMAMLDDCRAHS